MKTGPKDLAVNADTQLVIQAEKAFSVFKLGVDGEPEGIVAIAPSGTIKLTVREDCNLRINVPEGVHWFVTEKEVPSPFSKADPVPVEAPVGMEMELSLQERMERFIRQMVDERFGEKERESFEAFVDFGADEEDAVPLSGFEEQEPLPPADVTVKAEPEPPPPPDEPAAGNTA